MESEGTNTVQAPDIAVKLIFTKYWGFVSAVINILLVFIDKINAGIFSVYFLPVCLLKQSCFLTLK